MTTPTTIILHTRARTTAGIARAYVSQYGGTWRGESTRDHDATQDPDGTWTIWGCTGSRHDPRGTVRLAVGVQVTDD